jgi:hypothetical protein
MKALLQNILPLLAAALVATSCEKVIDVDLNTANPQLVIVGSVTNEPGSYRVEITKTLNFDQPNEWPPVQDALVIITDDAGRGDTLEETAPGVYATAHPVQGDPGRTYTLYVEAENQTFQAVSTMPQPVALENLTFFKTTVAGEERIALVPEFTDPAGFGNYYRFVQYNQGQRLMDIFILDDKNIDGNHILPPLFADSMPKPGQEATLEMQCIDRATYTYLYGLHANAGHGSVPANPENNFGGKALGYFSAHTVERRTVVVE